ncbi:MAG: hypothetical protein AAFQ43_11660 [Bacteroidota bacterium]
MTALRSTFAPVLIAVLALGGVVLPSVHHAMHGVEAATDRASHMETCEEGHEADEASGAFATAPCSPALDGVDCAVCSVVLVAADMEVASPPYSGGETAVAALADRAHPVALVRIGARAPPVG